MLEYKKIDTALTLRQGMKELRDYEGENGDVALKVGDEMQKVLKAHDSVHVVFGCDTSMDDEALAHFVMIFNTDVKFSDMREVAKNKDHVHIVGNHKKIEIFKVLLGAGKDLFNVLKLKQQMTKKWSWWGYEQYLDIPIIKIREEFKITPISRSK